MPLNEQDQLQLQQKKQDILSQDIRVATRLQEHVLYDNQQSETDFLSMQATKQDVSTIDQILLGAQTQELQITDKEKFVLKAVRGRNISHILVNQEKSGGDSEEMQQVKDSILELEKLLNAGDAEATEEYAISLEAAYSVAISHCKYYCDTKNPWFQAGIERKQMVMDTLATLQEEMQQVLVAKSLIKAGKLEGAIDTGRDLLVKAQEEMAKNVGNIEQPQQEEIPFESVTYEQFTQMVGTHNRGFVEFSEGKLKIVNNGFFSSKKVKESPENFRLRQRLYSLCVQKLGDNATEDAIERLNATLFKTGAALQGGALTRKEIRQAISFVNEMSSNVAQVLKKGEAASPIDAAFATKVDSMIGASVTSRQRMAVNAKEEKILKAEINAVLKKAKTANFDPDMLDDFMFTTQNKQKKKDMRIDVPQLSEHQMDNLVKGNISLLRDNVFLALKKLYDVMSHLNGGAVADYEAITTDEKIMNNITALVIGEMSALTEEGKVLAQVQMDAYLSEIAFKLAKKEELKENFDNVRVAGLSANAELGLDFAVRKQMTSCKEWKGKEKQVVEGKDNLEELCKRLTKVQALEGIAIHEGLSDAQAQELIDLGQQLQSMITNEQQMEVMGLVALNLQNTHYLSGFKRIQELLQNGFSFAEATKQIAESMTCNGKHGEIAGKEEQQKQEKKRYDAQETEDELKDFSASERKVLEVLLLKKPVSAYVEDPGSTAEMEYHKLRNVLRSLGKGTVECVDVTVSGTTLRILQKKDGFLEVIIGLTPITVPYPAHLIADRMDRDSIEHMEVQNMRRIADILREIELNTEDTAELVRCNTLCKKVIEFKTGLPGSYFNNIAAGTLREIALGVLELKLTADEIRNIVAPLENADYLTSSEVVMLMKKQEEQKKNRKKNGNVIMPKQQEEEEEDGFETLSKEEKQLRGFVADLFFSEESWVTDELIKNSPTTGLNPSTERIRKVIQKHLDIIAKVVLHPEIVTDFLDKLADLPSFSEEMRTQIKDGLVGFLNSEDMAKFKKYGNETLLRLGMSAMFRDGADGCIKYLADIDENIVHAVYNALFSIQENVHRATEEMFADDEQEVVQEQEGEQQEGEQQEEKTISDEEKLNKMIEKSMKGKEGQGKFNKLVLQNYFVEVSDNDKRAMFASAIRNFKPLKKLGENATQEQKDKMEKDTMANFLAGMLKGAGPLMHKLLQGLPMNGLPEEMKIAIQDMRSNLSPIPEDIVKARMNDIVERSHGSIEKIEVIKSLGAASVGQTFLCKIYGPNMPEEGDEVVVKLLRPDVRNRMMREVEIMKKCAADTDEKGGMLATYEGQLKRFEEELDLSIEAQNVKKGEVYDKVGKDVQAMKLNKFVEPTPSTLVLEKAEGETVDRLIGRLQKEFEGIKARLRVIKLGDQKVRSMMSSKNVEEYAQLIARMREIALELEKKQEYLVKLARQWVTEGIYGEGFYHGDLHAGNIMIGDNGLTVIDFGNATDLSLNQQKIIMRMMGAAASGATEFYLEGFHDLLENTTEEYYNSVKDQLFREVDEIFQLGGPEHAGQRILLSLLKAQELGLEVPPAIFNFSQSQMRMQNTIEEMTKLSKDTRKFYARMQNLVVNESSSGVDPTLLMLFNARDVSADNMMATDDMEENMQLLHEETTLEEFQRSMAGEQFDVMGNLIAISIVTTAGDINSKQKKILEAFETEAKRKEDEPAPEDKWLGVKDKIAPFIEQLTILVGTGSEEAVSEFAELVKTFTKCFDNPKESVELVKTTMSAMLRKAQEVASAFSDYHAAKKDGTVTSEMEEKAFKVASNGKMLKLCKMQEFEFPLKLLVITKEQDLLDDQKIVLERMFKDEEYGAQIREAYEATRAIEDQESPEFARRKVVFMSICRKKIEKELLIIKEAVKTNIPGKSFDNFITVMGNCIKENKMATINKLGGFEAIKFLIRMNGL